MNRRRFLSLSTGSLLSLQSLSQTLPAFAAPEPTYTITLPGNQAVSIRLSITRTPDGQQKVRVWNQPKIAAKSDLYIDTSMILAADGKPVSSQVFFGPNVDQTMGLEAIRKENGFTVREPELSGDLKFGAPLFVPLISELFVGKLYDFKRGGPQTFAHLLDTGFTTAKIATLTLTAEEEPEIIALPDGPAKARKIRYQLDEPLLPADKQKGIFYVGAKGEVLKCDTSFFGVPLRAKGPAYWEDSGKRFVLDYNNPDSGKQIVRLQGERQVSGDWAIKLKFSESTDVLATLTCDKNFRLKRMETPWHGRPFIASVVGTDTVHWTVKGGAEQLSPVSENSPVWFMPHWFVTELWEGSGGAFANMAVDETRDGQILPLFIGQRDAASFTLERRKDNSYSQQGTPRILRHYRFFTGGKQAAPEAVLPGMAARPPAPIYDIYTDGSRLVAFLTSDNIKIIRTGWEKYAAALPLPRREEAATPNP